MKPWLFAAAGLACLAPAGCRTDPEIARLEVENRKLEDEIWRLRERIEDLESCPTGTAGPALLPASPAASPRAGPPPAARPPANHPGTLEKIDVQVPEKPLPSGELPERFKTPDTPRGPGSLLGPGPDRPDAGPAIPGKTTLAPASASAQVARITLNQSLTGGYADGRQAAAGLSVVLEPRDARGRIIPAPGDISVVLVDPAARGPQGRVARWDLTAGQLADMADSGPEQGIGLRLAWPAAPPSRNRLHLFVRYTTRDGRKLQADRPIDLAVSNERSARWVPVERPPLEPAGPSVRPESVSPAPTLAPPLREPARTASRPVEPRDPRPVWSPERR